MTPIQIRIVTCIIFTIPWLVALISPWPGIILMGLLSFAGASFIVKTYAKYKEIKNGTDDSNNISNSMDDL